MCVSYMVFLILTVGLLCACLTCSYSLFFMKPVYTSTSTMLVLATEGESTTVGDLQMGNQLTNDYMVLLKSGVVLNEVIENLGLDTTYQGLQGNIEIENPTQTHILKVSVKHNKPEKAQEIVNELVHVAADYIGEQMEVKAPKIIEEGTHILKVSVKHNKPEKAQEIVNELVHVAADYIGEQMEVKAPKIIEEGALPTTKTSPSIFKNTILGLLIGLVLSAGLIVVRTVMDTSIKTEEDIEKYLGMSTLAMVPDRKDFIGQKKVGLLFSAGLIVVRTVMDTSSKTEEDIEKYLGLSTLAMVPDRKDFIGQKKGKTSKKKRKTSK